MPISPRDTTEERVATRRLDQFAPHQVYPAGPLENLDPVTSPLPGLISRTTRVGSVGSCFSAELRRWLIENGYNYLQTGVGPTSTYGSARFGIVLTSAALRQTFESAFGLFTPSERYWPYGPRLIDPYRKNIVWKDRAAADAELADHYASVRALVQQSEVFICTVGAAEYWRSRTDGAAFATVPPEGVLSDAKHEFVVSTVEENLSNLQSFYDLLRRFNPKLRLVISLSPVPLTATYRDMSCLAADSVSKATLRVAIDRFCAANPAVIYMPSYELVTKMAPDPYTDDNRHVRREVVARVMRTFMQHYGDLKLPEPALSA